MYKIFTFQIFFPGRNFLGMKIWPLNSCFVNLCMYMYQLWLQVKFFFNFSGKTSNKNSITDHEINIF